MTDKQPEALLIADELEEPIDGFPAATELESKAAAELRRLHAELETLRAGHDAARLDFLIKHQAYVVSDDTCCDGYWLRFPAAGGTTSVQIGEYETPRAAIDAARAAQEADGYLAGSNLGEK